MTSRQGYLANINSDIMLHHHLLRLHAIKMKQNKTIDIIASQLGNRR